jgi:lipopolysaccharide/colanic/teichoic acid biosynthesis glycosyltransferase
MFHSRNAGEVDAADVAPPRSAPEILLPPPGPARPPLDASRVLDIVIASLAIIFTSPLLLVLTALVWSKDRGPPIFSHERIGYGGRRFKCLKFRSMVIDAEARLNALLESDPEARREWVADHKLRADPRITPLGRFLRTSSLDELPQLFNILLGDMSVVGPRPIVQAEVCRYGRFFSHYCSVRPGLTGLWQTNGRNNTSYRARVAYDVLYARRKSMAMDVAIIFKTVPAVVMRRGCF